MIIESFGNMFHGNHDVLVCPVNMVGTMGKGLALYFSRAFPGLLQTYKGACRKEQFRNFQSVLVRGKPSVLLFPTKVHWMHDSKLSWINQGLANLRSLCETEGITDIGMPPIGCGNGHLDFADVKFLVYHHFENSPVRVHLYSPG